MFGSSYFEFQKVICISYIKFEYDTPIVNAYDIRHVSFAKYVNTQRPRKNGCYFIEDIFKLIFLPEYCCTFIQISLKYVTKRSSANKPALVQIMSW